MVLTPWEGTVVVGCEGMMEIGDGDDVPRVTRRGTRHEATFVINKVGDNKFHELMRELGDWGGM